MLTLCNVLVYVLGTEHWENNNNNLLLACTYICVGQKYNINLLNMHVL